MAIAHEFEYIKPSCLADAIEALARNPGKATVLAGGTDLVGWIKEDFITPETVIDIKGLSQLREITLDGDTLRIGALVTFNQLIESQLVIQRIPLLWESATVVACKPVRNRATLVGNLCSGIPCCDSGPPLLAYGATIVVDGPNGTRKIAAKDWFLGPRRTARSAAEIVTAVEVPVSGPESAGCYIKLGRYRGEDLAQVSVGVLATKLGFRVAFGAVGSTPLLAPKIEAVLGVPDSLNEAKIREAQELVEEEISPITDVRATLEYRMHMAKIMLKRGVETAAKRLSGRCPAYGTRLI